MLNSCANQRIFCDSGRVARWLADNGLQSGYEMDLATLWRLAGDWYSGRLTRGYRRREPTAAMAYFADVGLKGPFWGLVGSHSQEQDRGAERHDRVADSIGALDLDQQRDRGQEEVNAE